MLLDIIGNVDVSHIIPITIYDMSLFQAVKTLPFYHISLFIHLARTPRFADEDGREKLRSTSEIRILYICSISSYGLRMLSI